MKVWGLPRNVASGVKGHWRRGCCFVRALPLIRGWRKMLKLAIFGGIAAFLWLSVEWISVVQILLVLFVIYAATGGHKFLYLLYKTFPRDVSAGFHYAKILYRLRQCQKDNLTVHKVFAKHVRRHPDKVCFLYEDQTWTFSQVDEYSNQIANYFLENGFKHGETVALFMENRPEYVGIWLGLSKIGVVPALINFSLRREPLAHCITVAHSKAVIFGVELSDAINEVKSSFGDDIPFFFSGAGKDGSCSVPSVTNLDAEQETASKNCAAGPEVSFTDKLVFIYTSGTTGLPKAAVIRHSRCLMIGIGIYCATDASPGDVVYDPLPLYHLSGGIIGVGLALMSGLTVVLRRKFSVSSYWKDCIKHRCTCAQYIGEICRYLLNVPPCPEEKQHNIRIMFGNGLRPQIWEQFMERFNVPRISEFYGATEGNANIINTDNKVGAVGFVSRIIPWIYPVTLIPMNPDTGEPVRDGTGICVHCQPGQPGELVGKIVPNHPVRDFHGYADQSATRKKVIRDVFKKGDMAFLSGDLLVMDELGYLYFKDRTGDTFRWRGENVSTSEVEGVISTVVGLKDAVVYGVQVPGCEGRAGMTAILDPDDVLDLEVLATGCLKSLTPYARPLFVRVVKQMDMTGTYKLKKLDLQKDGFNPSKITDKLYIMNGKKYEPLTEDIYQTIMDGKMRL